jgi:hypothetical protein
MDSAIYFTVGIALILVAWDWRVKIPRHQGGFSLIVTTMSCLWMCLFLAWRGACGPDGSFLHASIVFANIIATLVSAILAAVFRSQRSLRTLIAALALMTIWGTNAVH